MAQPGMVLQIGSSPSTTHPETCVVEPCERAGEEGEEVHRLHSPNHGTPVNLTCSFRAEEAGARAVSNARGCSCHARKLRRDGRA